MESLRNLIDESLVTTPQPKATSTTSKIKENGKKVDRKIVPVPLNYSTASEASVSSLGALNAEDINAIDKHLLSRLKTQHQLAPDIRERAYKTAGLPSKYFRPDSMFQKTGTCNNEQSTVNESDLIGQNFHPNDVSTPRTSDAPEKPFESVEIVFQNITEMSHKIRNSDISLHDIFSQQLIENLGKFSMPQTSSSGFNSQHFTPAELMGEKLLQDEMSWRREKAVPNHEKLRDSIVSIGNLEKPSMGEFFKTKKNELGDMFKVKSPEKLHVPSPLIDVTNMSNIGFEDLTYDDTKSVMSEENSSVLSATHIQRVLSELALDTPNKVIEHLLNNGKLEKNRRASIGQEEKKSTLPPNSKLEKNKRASIGQEEKKSTLPPHIKLEENKRKSTLPPNSKCPPKTDTLLKAPKENDCDEYIAMKNSRRDSKSPSTSTSYENLESSDEIQSQSRMSLRTSIAANFKDNKENLSDRGSVGSRCPSSLDSIPEGKLPIKGSKLEVVWGCLKVGRTSTQSLWIRNQLNQRIRVQVSVTGSSFRIVKERGDTEMLTSLIFMLHPLETKHLSVMFYPMAVGGVYERLNFYPFSNGEISRNLKQSIKLYGYGGHSSIDMTKLAKDPTGKLWLTLGSLDHKPVIKQDFTIKNNGVLSAFALLELRNDSMSKLSQITISPKQVVIEPQQQVKITVSYSPTKHDYKHQQEIIGVGLIKITSGAEVIRGRLRRLCTLLSQKNESIDPFIVTLSKKFPNENMPLDLSIFTESTATIKELLEQLVTKRINLTIERDPDATFMDPMREFEDITTYQTLYQDRSTFIEETDNKGNLSNNPFRIEPSSLFFSLPYKKEDAVLLHSKSSTPMTYQIEISEGFTASPSTGRISNGDTVIIKISCSEVPPGGKGKASIYLENELMEVTLKAVFIGKK